MCACESCIFCSFLKYFHSITLMESFPHVYHDYLINFLFFFNKKKKMELDLGKIKSWKRIGGNES